MGCSEEGCEDLQISPDGKSVIWSAKKKLWLATVDGKQQAKELASVRGAAVSPKWSPDGKHLAFVSLRDSHSLIAIYDFGLIGGLLVSLAFPHVGIYGPTFGLLVSAAFGNGAGGDTVTGAGAAALPVVVSL